VGTAGLAPPGGLVTLMPTVDWVKVAVAAVVALAAIAAIVLTVVLRGSDQTVERVFRLLRWAANRPEPQTPGPAPEHR
jgi:hypothetical protein